MLRAAETAMTDRAHGPERPRRPSEVSCVACSPCRPGPSMFAGAGHSITRESVNGFARSRHRDLPTVLVHRNVANVGRRTRRPHMGALPRGGTSFGATGD